MDVRKRFLDAIAAPESGGRYNIRYTPKGGTTFDGFDAHPRIFEPGPAGPSSAAGRYQITATTYDRLGGGKFGPSEQDDMAWRLANEDYKSRTGRNLEEDLKTEGFSDRIRTSLAPTWLGLKDNPQKAITAWNDGLPSTGAVQNAAAATPAATPAAAAPVYSADLGTAARWLGNKIAPDMVDAPTPLTPDQVTQQNADLASYGSASKGLGGMASGLLQLAKLAEEPQEKVMQLQPIQPMRRAEFIPVKKLRGLL